MRLIRPQLSLSIGAAAAFLFPILWTLLTSVPGTFQQSINDITYDERGVPVEMRGRWIVEGDGSHFVLTTRLRARDAEFLLAYQQIRLRVASYGSEQEFLGGELRFSDRCTYRTPRATPFRNDALLTFVRGADCSSGKSADADVITLTLRFNGAARAGLWTFVRDPSSTSERALLVSTFGLPRHDVAYVARGMVVNVVPDTRASRLSLLTYVWSLSSSAVWILLALGACAFSLALAAYLLARAPCGAVQSAAGVFAAALAFGGSYAVLVPPFQAADEPSHFAALANALARPGLNDEASALARRDHFEEIQFNGDRRFSPLDRRTLGIPWNDNAPADPSRGTGVLLLWKLAALLFGGLPAPLLLLAMRLVDALVFALAAAAFVAIVHTLAGAEYPALVAVPIFLVPSVPYFATCLSNYAPLVSTYVLLAAAVAVAFGDGCRSYLAGPLLGASLLGAIAISRSAVPLLPFVACVLFARVVLGDRWNRRWPAVVYWASVTAASVLISKVLMRYGVASPNMLTPIWAIAFGALLFTAELAASAIRKRLPPMDGRAAERTRRTALTAALALTAVLAGSLVVRYPMLAPLDPAVHPRVAQYVEQAEIVCGTFLRFGRPDHLTSMTFWAGFGWLEAFPPWIFISLLASVGGIALIALLMWIASARASRALVLIAFIAMGFAASVAAYAYSVIRATPADLHGRYLIGLYLALLVVAWIGPERLVVSSTTKWKWRVAMLVGSAAVAAHVYCVCFILRRYF